MSVHCQLYLITGYRWNCFFSDEDHPWIMKDIIPQLYCSSDCKPGDIILLNDGMSGEYAFIGKVHLAVEEHDEFSPLTLEPDFIRLASAKMEIDEYLSNKEIKLPEADNFGTHLIKHYH